MGFIRSVDEPRRWAVMKQDFLIGRDESCDLVLGRPGVSKRHALVRWDGQHWVARDLGSRNGTFVRAQGSRSSERIPNDRGVRLALHDRLLFAEMDEQWSVVNVDEPRTLLTEEGQSPDCIILLDAAGVVAVPSEDRLRATMHRDRVSGLWMVEEIGSGPRAVNDGEVLVILGRSYRLHVVESTDTAQAERSPLGPSLADVQLGIHPASDEESAALSFRSERRTFCSERRAHLYLLVHLARRRLGDAHAGKDEAQCGWLSTDAVQEALGYRSAEHLAVDVFRCRKELKTLDIGNATEVIERGRRGQMRIGVASARLHVCAP